MSATTFDLNAIVKKNAQLVVVAAAFLLTYVPTLL